VNYVYKLDPNDTQVRQIKADALGKMGQLAFGSIGRSFLLSEARALEGKEDIPKVVPPNPAINRRKSHDLCQLPSRPH
jgi:hypothetical protein